jgi:hypothetical protein
MIATRTHEIEVTEAELVRLIGEMIPLDLVFGPNHAALVWREGEPISRAVQRLAELRGVGTEGCDGESI